MSSRLTRILSEPELYHQRVLVCVLDVALCSCCNFGNSSSTVSEPPVTAVGPWTLSLEEAEVEGIPIVSERIPNIRESMTGSPEGFESLRHRCRASRRRLRRVSE